MKYLYNAEIKKPVWISQDNIEEVKKDLQYLKKELQATEKAIVAVKALGMPSRSMILNELEERKKDITIWLQEAEKAKAWFESNKIK